MGSKTAQAIQVRVGAGSEIMSLAYGHAKVSALSDDILDMIYFQPYFLSLL